MISSSLPPELEKFVQQEIETGKYRTVDEVVCEALRLLRERKAANQEAALREELRPALERLDRGEGIVVTQENLRGFFDRIVDDVDRELAVEEKRR